MSLIDGFSTRVRDRLRFLGKEQKDLAAHLKITEGGLSGWFAGKRPTYENLELAAAFLEVTPCFLAFGSDKTAQDAGEASALAQWRKIPEAKRADVLAALMAVAGVAPDPELILLGEKAKAKAEARAAAKPAAASLKLVGVPTKSEPLLLSQEEADALSTWLGREVETMPIERPLTKAIRKIAMRVDHDSVPEAPAPGSGKGASSAATGAENVPSVTVPLPPHGRRTKGPKPS